MARRTFDLLARLGVWLCAIQAVPVAAAAATLSIVPDKTTYSVGEPVVVQLVGNPQGASDAALFARLRFEASILGGGSVVALTPTSSAGAFTWLQGTHACGAGYCDVLNTIGGLSPLPVDQSGSQVWATATLQAAAPGTANLTLELVGPQQTGFELDFFGLSSASAVPIQVVAADIPAAGRIELVLLALLLFAGAAWALRTRARAVRA
jgi:hypothetical protein